MMRMLRQCFRRFRFFPSSYVHPLEHPPPPIRPLLLPMHSLALLFLRPNRHPGTQNCSSRHRSSRWLAVVRPPLPLAPTLLLRVEHLFCYSYAHHKLHRAALPSPDCVRDFLRHVSSKILQQPLTGRSHRACMCGALSPPPMKQMRWRSFRSGQLN
jgi:hypothetical protein